MPLVLLLTDGLMHFLHTRVVCYHYLEAVEVCRLEVIWGASAPVDNVLVLALTAQFTVPVGDAQVVIHHALTGATVPTHCGEERLARKQKKRQKGEGGEEAGGWGGGGGSRDKIRKLYTFYFLQHSIHREEIE